MSFSWVMSAVFCSKNLTFRPLALPTLAGLSDHASAQSSSNITKHVQEKQPKSRGLKGKGWHNTQDHRKSTNNDYYMQKDSPSSKKCPLWRHRKTTEKPSKPSSKKCPLWRHRKTTEKPSKTEARKTQGQAAKIRSKMFSLLTSPWGRPAKPIEAFFESQECSFALMQSRRFKLCQKEK